MILLLSLSLALLPVDNGILADRVDVSEVNHFYDDHGKLIFDQVIWWDWSDEERRFQVRAWRLLKLESQFPLRDWSRGGYATIWMDGQVLRVVRSGVFWESWTQYDVELVQRRVLSKDKRRELRRR